MDAAAVCLGDRTGNREAEAAAAAIAWAGSDAVETLEDLFELVGWDSDTTPDKTPHRSRDKTPETTSVDPSRATRDH